MSKTKHKNERTGEEFPAKSRKKQKDSKFFGYRDEPRNGNKYGKKRSYGHFAGGAIYPKHLANIIRNPPPDMDEE
jgi:hypothetical protein